MALENERTVPNDEKKTEKRGFIYQFDYMLHNNMEHQNIHNEINK